MSKVEDRKDDDDGIHPLDRDYSKPIPVPRRKLTFSKSRGINLGILGFGVGGIVLLIGIVLSQFGNTSRAMETMAVSAHRLGMWSILIGGGSVLVGMQARTDKLGRKRRPKRNDVLQFSIVSRSANAPLCLAAWKSALEEFHELVSSPLTMDCLTPELEDVYLGADGLVVAVLSWDRAQAGCIRMRVRRRDVDRVKQMCPPLLRFLDARLVADSTG